jgi:hypothetical protein
MDTSPTMAADVAEVAHAVPVSSTAAAARVRSRSR